MSTIDFQPVLKSLHQYHGEYFDEKAPSDLVCSISQDLIQHPPAVDCHAGHVFEQESLNGWLKENKSCPDDPHPVTTTYRNPAFEINLKNWTEQHLVRPIEPEQIAKSLLAYDCSSDHVKASAHLRFIRIAGLSGEVAKHMIKMIEAENPQQYEKSEEERFAFLQKLVNSRNLYGEEEVLNDIVQEVSDALLTQSSPRLARLMQIFEDRIKEYMQALDGRVEASEKRIMEALDRRIAEILDQLRKANIQEETDRERVMALLDQLVGRMGCQEAEAGPLRDQMGKFQHQIQQVQDAIRVEEDNYGPLTWMEELKLVISVIGPVALCALARGCAAYMDNDPNTRFVSAFLRFNFIGIVAGAWRILEICHAGWTAGKPALHKMSAQVTPEQFAMAVITASITYQQSVTSANANWVARQQSDIIFAQNTIIDRLRAGQDLLTQRV